MNEELHRNNVMLPQLIKVKLMTEASTSASEIEELCKVCNKLVESVEDKLCSRLVRLIKTHRSLKYFMQEEIRELCAMTLINVFENSREISLSFKVNLIQLIKELCKKDLPFISSISLDWNKYWIEIMNVINRNNRYEAIGSENVLVKYVSKLSDFMHSMRYYFGNNREESLETMINASKLQLLDKRLPKCIEGVLLLLTCLPTAYKNYDEVLPDWIATWESISHNVSWDCCWLTLLTRARKHSKLFDWQSIAPLLYIKLRELFQLPIQDRGHQPQSSEYPHSFPSFYSLLLNIRGDTRTVAINKASKLLYFIQSIDQNNRLVQGVPISVTPSTTAEYAFDGDLSIPGYSDECPGDLIKVRNSAVEFVFFLQSIRSFFYPSNSGSWSNSLATFLSTFVIQICRHVGRSVYIGITTNEGTGMDQFHNPIHIQTIRYLCGAACALVVEGLYCKVPSMSQWYIFCLKNIIAIDSVVAAKVAIPLILASLSPSRVNQSHLAPIAMQTVTHCFRSLMYPQPLMLPYIPELLKLSLPGLDPSDPSKTVTTLTMYSTLLGWLPVRSTYEKNIRSDLNSGDGNLSNYLGLAQSIDPESINDPKVGLLKAIPADTVKDQLESLAAYWDEWCQQLLEKIFSLLEGLEAPLKGTSKESSLTVAIAHCTGFLFQSLQPLPEETDYDETLRSKLEQRVIQYFSKSTPINAVKSSAKIIESVVTPRANPAILLDQIIATLVDQDVLNGSLSAEKLAFRIRLVGGAVRGAQDTLLTNGQSVEKIMRIFLPSQDGSRGMMVETFIQHDEKVVRKAASKLLKDFLKGISSFYPLTKGPNLGWTSDTAACLCTPTVTHSTPIAWYVPTKLALKTTVAVLNAVIVDTIRNLNIALDSVFGLEESDYASQSKLRLESKQLSPTQLQDFLSSRFRLMSRALRGAAEVLGDDDCEIESQSHVSVDRDLLPYDEDEEANTAESNLEGDTRTSAMKGTWLSTGRETVWNEISEEERRILLTVRSQVIQFITKFQRRISLPTSSMASSNCQSLRDNLLVNKECMKCLHVVITRRQATMKDYEHFLKGMKYTKRAARSSVSKVVYKSLKRDKLLGVNHSVNPSNSSFKNLSETWKQRLRDVEYWKGHDLTTNDMSYIGFIHYIGRVRQLAASSCRQHLNLYQQVRKSAVLSKQSDSVAVAIPHTVEGSFGFFMMKSLFQLNDHFCSHEFDSIRSKACKYFERLSSYFGHHIVFTMIKPLIMRIANALPFSGQDSSNAIYARISGAISVLNQGLVMKKIVGHPALVSLFLQNATSNSPRSQLGSGGGFQAMMNFVSECDKRQILTNQFSQLFVKYSSSWHVIANSQKNVANNFFHLSSILQSAFQSFARFSSAAEDTSPVSIGGSMRFETYSAFIILHLVGHPLLSPSTPNASFNQDSIIPLTSQMWEWSLHSLSSDHGQPQQTLAMAGLSRLVRLGLLSMDSPDVSPLQSKYNAALQSILHNNHFSNGTVHAAKWEELLKGFANSLPKQDASSDGSSSSAQWSQGIDSLLRTSDFLKVSFSRSFAGTKSDRNLYSNIFKREDVAILFGLFRILFSLESFRQNIEVHLTAILEVAKNLPFANESESRSNNVVRCELFAAIMRIIRSNNGTNKSSSLSAGFEDLETRVILPFLRDLVDECSMELSKDWAEAINFIYSDVSSASPILCNSSHFVQDGVTTCSHTASETIPQYILEEFRKQTRLSADSSESVTTEPSVAAEEGFSKQGKVLLLLRSLLEGDVTCCVSFDNQSAFSSSPSLPLFSTLSSVALVLLHELQSPDCEIISPHRTSRVEFGTILGYLMDVTHSAFHSATKNSISKLLIHPNVATELSGCFDVIREKIISRCASTESDETAKNVTSKHAIETATLWLQVLIQRIPELRSEAHLPDLLEVIIVATGRQSGTEIDVAKLCYMTSLFVCRTIVSVSFATVTPAAAEQPVNIVERVVTLLRRLSSNPSWRVRETVMSCLSIILINNSSTLPTELKKVCRDVFTNGLIDVKPEVLTVAQFGMTVYLLSCKTNLELQQLADAYTKNSDALMDREKKKKKASANGNASLNPPDAIYHSTIMMSSCIIQAFPHDLPPYIPSLLTSFTRHIHIVNVPSLKEVLLKTIQQFRRSHQDRWDELFKDRFTREQLEDLQGVGAATYFN